MDGEAIAYPTVRIRGRSFMAMVVAPEPPFAAWFAAFDRQLAGLPDFFSERPVVVDLAPVVATLGAEAIPVALDGLAERGLKIVGLDGARPAMLAAIRWADMPTRLHGRDVPLTPRADPEPAEPAPAAPSLLIDRQVRSGQSVVFDEGDVTVIGSVASGAEVIAGGSVHIYGTLRGRVIAGLRTGGSRIFCRRLEAELVGVDQLYRTAEHWGADLHGRAAQVRSDRGALRIEALD